MDKQKDSGTIRKRDCKRPYLESSSDETCSGRSLREKNCKLTWGRGEWESGKVENEERWDKDGNHLNF